MIACTGLDIHCSRAIVGKELCRWIYGLQRMHTQQGQTQSNSDRNASATLAEYYVHYRCHQATLNQQGKKNAMELSRYACLSIGPPPWALTAYLSGTPKPQSSSPPCQLAGRSAASPPLLSASPPLLPQSPSPSRGPPCRRAPAGPPTEHRHRCPRP